MKTKIKLLSLFTALILIDQALKYFSNETICNPNIAWGIPIVPAIFYFIWIIIIAILILIFLKTEKYYQKIFLIFIFAGALSNMIDRIKFGCVVDYIDLKIFPIFNLADTYITVGILILAINILRNKSREATP
jgi:signal peptidase II